MLDWMMGKIVLPVIDWVCTFLVIGCLVTYFFAIFCLYEHRNDPPSSQFSLRPDDWACTRTHQESYGKGQHREVCDQYTRVNRITAGGRSFMPAHKKENNMKNNDADAFPWASIPPLQPPQILAYGLYSLSDTTGDHHTAFGISPADRERVPFLVPEEKGE